MENLSKEDKEVLARAISFYYENYVWTEFVEKDSSAASDEDHRLRKVYRKLDLQLPLDIISRF